MVNRMTRSLGRPLGGVAVAIGITTAMDAGGLTAFSALPLFPLMLLLWYAERPPRLPMGFSAGRTEWYGLAILYPLAVLGSLAAIAHLAGATNLVTANWATALRQAARVGSGTLLVVILTEEGFFRGWLWSSLRRAEMTPTGTLIVTSVCFSLWHLSWATLTADGRLPATELPVFMVNAAVIGAIWGLLRAGSGSVFVPSLSHGLWNGIDYVFFGAAAKTGALGIANTAVYGPEIGLLGLAANVVVAVLLWRWWRARAPVDVSEPGATMEQSGASQ